MTPAQGAEQDNTQRIDKWLWCARFFKTRTLAGKAVSAGDIRVTRAGNTQRVAKASFCIQPGDTLSFTRGERLFIIEIASTATRRGPAPEARALYDDQSPPPPPRKEKPAVPFAREQGAGRPTKKDRRALDQLREDDE
ncbi:RNA-binding S4 domain-containing protein [Parvularcula flava]|uniref:RNA-binding S4 domain-containing protein n=1 Tax=Aquisalinus luteolus TaxID=1566827 RepID=A0A8J3ETK4_9PROT|nr:RNA-binding S4 domain-containing protein [Aquisalinus luteolus]NHK27052.1 RNA-binding S4 domain-containing protein [Aquisalinus luteolus]GGH94220.1 RNA-binding protein S4 [Aquisalinus luteolus]